jgi:hypothetical protein
VLHETRALSYIEIAELFDITVPSARNMVRKRCWSRIRSNDGKTVRVSVPLDALPSPSTRPVDASPDGARGDARDAALGETSAALIILAKHIEALQAELEPLRATAAQVANAALDAARGDARRLREERDMLIPVSAQAAALRAALDAARDLREQRRWWRLLTG